MDDNTTGGQRVEDPSRGRPPRSCSPPPPSWRGSAGATSRTANEAPLIHRRGEAGLGGVAAYALDRDNAERLWEVSLETIAAV